MKRVLAFIFFVAANNLGFAQEDENIPSLVGSWEGPLVIGRDSTNLAFTFSTSNVERLYLELTGDGLRYAVVPSGCGRKK